MIWQVIDLSRKVNVIYNSKFLIIEILKMFCHNVVRVVYLFVLQVNAKIRKIREEREKIKREKTEKRET